MPLFSHPTPRDDAAPIAEPSVSAVTLTLLLLVSIWGFYALYSYESYQVRLQKAESGLIQRTHALRIYVDNLFRTARVIHTTLDHWMANNPRENPRINGHLAQLVDALEHQTDHLVTARLIDRLGNLFYIPNGSAKPQDNVADREYFQALWNKAPRVLHVGIPVESRVEKSWRVPVTSRMASAHRSGIEAINVPIDLTDLIASLDSHRVKPGGTVSVWRSDGVLLAQSAADKQDVVGKVAPANGLFHRIPEGGKGVFLWPGQDQGAGGDLLVSYARLLDVPLVIAMTCPRAKMLEEWWNHHLRNFLALLVLSVLTMIFSLRLNSSFRLLKVQSGQLTRYRDNLEETLRDRTHEIEHLNGQLIATFNACSEGIHIVDQHGRLLSANPAFLKLIGWDKEAAAGLAASNWLCFPDENGLNLYREAYAANRPEPRMVDSVFVRKSGEKIDVSLGLQVFDLDGERLVCAAVRDVSQEKSRIETLRYMLKEYRRVNDELALRDRCRSESPDDRSSCPHGTCPKAGALSG